MQATDHQDVSGSGPGARYTRRYIPYSAIGARYTPIVIAISAIGAAYSAKGAARKAKGATNIRSGVGGIGQVMPHRTKGVWGALKVG